MANLGDPTSFTAFMSSRCRAYVVSQDEADKPQMGYRHHGCNCYSSGEAQNSECILPSAWPHMLAWLDVLCKDRTYAEEVVVIGADQDEEVQQAMEGLTCKTEDEELKESKRGLVVEKEAETKLGTQDDLKDGGGELEPKAEDVKQKTVKWDDANETIPNKVAEVNDTRPKPPKPAPEKAKRESVKSPIYESDDGYSGDVEEMGSSYTKRETSVSETDTL